MNSWSYHHCNNNIDSSRKIFTRCHTRCENLLSCGQKSISEVRNGLHLHTNSSEGCSMVFISRLCACKSSSATPDSINQFLYGLCLHSTRTENHSSKTVHLRILHVLFPMLCIWFIWNGQAYITMYYIKPTSKCTTIKHTNGLKTKASLDARTSQ